MTWKRDPGLDPAAMAEKQARQTDALETVAAAIDGGDFDRARLELAAIDAEARRAAAAVDADPTPEAPTLDSLRTRLDAADPVGAAGIRPLQDFAGRELPRRVLWMDSRLGGGTVLRVGDVAVIGGAGGVGKSFATLALAVAAASTDPDPGPGPAEAVGLHVRRGGAVLIGYEDDPVTVAWRAGLIAARSGAEPSAIPDRLAVVPDPSPLMEADYERPGNIRDSDSWPALWDGIAARAPSLVIVDPASAALSGVNQNDGGTVRHFVRALAREAGRGGFGVVIVAHSTKDARYGGAPGPGAVAGSGQWWDAARGVLFMRGDGPDRAAIECLKANHGPTGWAVTLEADRRPRHDKPDVFAGWRRTGRYSPEEWAAELERRKASGNGAARKPDTSEKRANGVTAQSGPYAPGELGP